MSDNITKINFSHKKLVGKQHTWNSKKWFEEEDGLILYPHSDQVWIDIVETTPPNETTPIIKKYSKLKLVEDKTVQNRRAWKAVDSSGNRLRGFIPPSYGIDYTVSVFCGGEKLPTSHQSKWLFDYTNGVLSFENTPPSGDIEIGVYQYTGRTLSQYIDYDNNSIARGILGIDEPRSEYTIQHNMNTFEVDVILYVYDDVNGANYWKKDVVPMMLLDENKVFIQLTEERPIRFIVKSYLSHSF